MTLLLLILVVLLFCVVCTMYLCVQYEYVYGVCYMLRLVVEDNTFVLLRWICHGEYK